MGGEREIRYFVDAARIDRSLCSSWFAGVRLSYLEQGKNTVIRRKVDDGIGKRTKLLDIDLIIDGSL